jgi:heme exporter protein CcmD
MDVLAMGSYGSYVWACFSLTAAVLVICEWRLRLRQRRVYRDLEVRIKALEGDQ